MPDIVELGIAINTGPLVEGMKAMDAMGEASVRVEGKVAGATRSIDELSTASGNVWRRGTDAAKSVDALGEATQRTGQRAAVSNGQMDDTSKIMRAQAEAARQATQANAALGNTTTQMTLGQQLFIDKLRDQVAVLGMSRSQLLAYQAAELGVTQETEKLIAKMKQFEDQTRAAAEASKAAAAAKREQERAALTLGDAVGLLGKAYAALKVAEYIKESALLAARYETLGVVVEVVGRNAGYTKTQMDTATDAIARQGITMVESRESATKLVQAHVDLKNATVLARIAQDAAVIGHLNSSDAFDRLVNGISRGNVLILRNIGINVNLQTAYRQMADELGKTTKELSENERVQARLNAVIDRGSDIAGTYEAAMGTAGKQITSMQRYMTDLKTVAGETFLEVLTVTVMALTKGFKDANGEVSEMSRNNQLHEWGSSLAQVFVTVADNVNNAFSAVKILAAGAAYASSSMNIQTQYKSDVLSAGFSVSEQLAAYDKMKAAAEANLKQLTETKDQILAGEDKFQHAYDERAATQAAKRKAAGDAQLKIDSDYAARSQALLIANAGKSLKIQQDAQIALANSVYVGTPTYRDTEGREPKEKVDQAENTQLADKLKRFEAEATATKHHYDDLGKLDDMYLKAGELSAQQSYTNKRDYALKTYEAQVDAYDRQIDALTGHNSATKAEAAKHQKELNDILGKRDAAERAFFAEGVNRDEQERLRKDAVVNAADAAAVKEIATINAQVAAVEMQIRTYNMLPAAKTAVAIADLEEQNAALAGFENSEKMIALNERKIEGLRRLAAAQGIATAQDTGSDVTKAKELLDILQAVDTATKAAAAGMTESFGKVGTAIGGLTTALSGYAVQQQAIAAQLAVVKADPKSDADKIAKAEIAASKSSAQAKVKSYGDMASAAKGFFKENSTGYKVMEGVEKAYRAAEMAMAIESMLTKSGLLAAFTGLFVTSKTVEAAATVATVPVTVAAEGVKQAALATTAMAGAIAVPFPGSLVAVGIVAAMLAAIGLSGGGGGASAPSISEQRQKAAGTGTVLGDESAKSESLSKSLELAAKNSSIELTHTAGMLNALITIRDNIGNLASLAVRTAGLRATAQDEKTYGVGSSSGFLGIGASSTTIKDSGINIKGGQTVGSVVDSGILAEGYADIEKKKSGLWGLGSSTKTTRQITELDDALTKQFSLIVGSLRDGTLAALDVLGIGGAGVVDAINKMGINIGEISFAGLTGTEIEDQLNAIFSKVGDDMAAIALPDLTQFQKAGEGLFETLTRVAANYANLDSIMESVGSSFGATGVASIAARERLISLAGGIDELASQTSSFADNFLSEAERLAPVQKYVTDQLAAMGLAGITTREQFKDVALGIDKTTEAGAKQYTAMLALSDAFAKVYAATEDLSRSAQDIADERKELQSKLDEATMTSIQLREKERSSIAASNQALYDAVIIQTERKDLQTELDGLTMTSAQLRERERAAISDSNLALFDQITAIKKLADAAKALLSGVDTAMSGITKAVNAEKAAMAAANTLLMKSLQTQIDATTVSVTKLTSLSSALHSALSAVDAPGQEAASRASAQAQIAAALAIGKAGGPLPSADSLKDALTTIGKDSSDQFSSFLDYQRDQYRTANDISGLADLTDDQLSVEQKMLNALTDQKTAAQAAYDAEVVRLDGILTSAQQQVDALKGINSSVLSVVDAMVKLSASISAAMANPVAALPSTITGAYNQYLGRDPEAGAIDYWTGAAGNGADVAAEIKGSNEAQIAALYKSVFGHAGDTAGVGFWTTQLNNGASLDQIKKDFLGSDEYLSKLPGFAAGGDHAGGLRLVGENGPEIEATGPARIFTASQTRSMLSGNSNNNAELVAEIRALRAEVASLRAPAEATAKSAESSSMSLKRAMQGQDSFVTRSPEVIPA